MASVRSITTVTLQLLKDCVNQLPLESWLPSRKSRLGRRGYRSRALFLAYLLKIRENIPHDTVLARKLEENGTYRDFCGFRKGNIPSHDTFSRFFRKLTIVRLEKLFTRLDSLLAASGIFDRDELAIDATDVLSNSRNKHNPDLEAGYGHKSDKERFHGYWVVTVAGTVSEIPRTVRVTPADVHQSMTAQYLFDALEKSDLRNVAVLTADAAYDDKKTYARCIELGTVPVIAYNPKRSKIKIFTALRPSNWRKRCLGSEGVALRGTVSHQRGAVERYQSTFKSILNGRSVPIRGLIRVTRHVYGALFLSQIYAAINWRLQQNAFTMPIVPLLAYF